MKEHNYFVRTRDKIYQCRDDFVILKDQELYVKHFQDHIVKTADTIEELCDEYVAVGIPFRTFIVDLNELKRSGLDIHSFSKACYMQYKKCTIYGAIYTDNGLIYVAKMNKEGELEVYE